MSMLRTFKIIFPVAFVLFFISCVEDDGNLTVVEDGTLGQVFEVVANFNQANEFSSLFSFPNNLEVFEADQALVFLLEDVIDNGDGTTTDVFTPVPQSFFLNQGTLQYGFNHTFEDVSLFLTANFDLTTLSDDFTQNQIFRIVVLPGEFAQSFNGEFQNFELLMNSLNKSNRDIIKIVQ